VKLPRRQFLHLAAGAAGLPAVSRIARAQAYPTRPVRIIVGFPEGGAGSNIGTEVVVRAPPDGSPSPPRLFPILSTPLAV
jgi:tripartite-type tricarboxylate transporter receptor subunit TctC